MEKIDWGNLGFGYVKTDYNIRCYYRDGQWGEPFLTDDENVTMSMAATCLHYGQESFEGLKAYRSKDGFVNLFRVDDNAKRMSRSADYLRMVAPPVALVEEMVRKGVGADELYIPR